VHLGNEVFEPAVPSHLFREFVGSEELSFLASLAGHIDEEIGEAVVEFLDVRQGSCG
jgi:hypothetical protein